MSFDPLPPRNRSVTNPGKYAGLSDFLRSLQVGENKPCPRRWENCLHSSAERMGIKIATRRLGMTEETMVWRTA